MTTQPLLRLPKADDFIKKCSVNDNEFLPSDCTFVKCLGYFLKKWFIERIWKKGGVMLTKTSKKTCGINDLSIFERFPEDDSLIPFFFNTNSTKTPTKDSVKPNEGSTSVEKTIVNRSPLSKHAKAVRLIFVLLLSLMFLSFTMMMSYNVWLYIKYCHVRNKNSDPTGVSFLKENRKSQPVPRSASERRCSRHPSLSEPFSINEITTGTSTNSMPSKSYCL
ncbi:unnamed protein product, partial [Phytomonas sp. Hart1]